MGRLTPEVESIARELHETGARVLRERGSPIAQFVDRPWDELEEDSRETNRAVVTDLLDRGIIESGPSARRQATA